MSPAPIRPRPRTHPIPIPPPPPTSPQIRLFPRSRRTRRKNPHNHRHYKGKLRDVFDREIDDSPGPPLDFEKRERAEEECERRCNGGGGERLAEEKWRFQAEILRAECNYLRLEREFALKKLEQNRVKMERTLRSAVQTLTSGKEKIFEGKNANAVLEEEIEDLAEKLAELQKSSRIKHYELPNCSNFDTKACLLQRQLEKLGGLSEEASLINNFNSSPGIDKEGSSITKSNCEVENKSIDVDEDGKKIGELSNEMCDRAGEEYNCDSTLSREATSSVSSSASTSKRAEFSNLSGFSTGQSNQEPVLNDCKCSGRCKAVIRRIVEQVRAEAEQWSQMQGMLRQVRGEMEELQASRDFWANQARKSDYEIQSLMHSVQEWKEKALAYENNANELKVELSVLKEEINKKVEAEPFLMKDSPPLVPLGKQLEKAKLGLSRRVNATQRIDDEGCSNLNGALKEQENKGRSPINDLLPPLSLGKQLAKEMKKRMLLHRLKENSSHRPCKKNDLQEPSDNGKIKPCSNSNRFFLAMEHSPLRDVGNSTTLVFTP